MRMYLQIKINEHMNIHPCIRCDIRFDTAPVSSTCIIVWAPDRVVPEHYPDTVMMTYSTASSLTIRSKSPKNS